MGFLADSEILDRINGQNSHHPVRLLQFVVQLCVALQVHCILRNIHAMQLQCTAALAEARAHTHTPLHQHHHLLGATGLDTAVSHSRIVSRRKRKRLWGGEGITFFD